MSDYISRENAIEAAIGILEGLGYHMKHNERFLDEVEAAFDEVETADVAPVVRGKWVNGRECSACGFDWSDWLYEWEIRFNRTNYCPNCGALMDKDGDGDV